jgi:hypothetical protein
MRERIPQTDQGDLAIPMLTSGLTGDDGDAGRQVREADAGLGLVLVLATGPAGPEGLDPALDEETVVVFGHCVTGRKLGVRDHITE